MHQMFQHYHTRLTLREAKERTLRNHRRTATLFEEAGLDPLTAKDWEIEEWLIRLPLSPRTKRLHFENLSAVYGYAVHRGLIERSPMEFVKLPRTPDEEPHILETEELRRVIRNAQTDQDILLAYLPIFTGMRRAEIRNLLWEHVKLSASTITVVDGKGDKLRHVPIHPRLAEVLVACRNPRDRAVISYLGEPLSDAGLATRLDRIRDGVDCCFHDFRRTVATSLAENAVPERIIDGIMGWAARTVGNRYYIRKADPLMQEGILRLYADDPVA